MFSELSWGIIWEADGGGSVCCELVSAVNSLVSGNLAGKRTYLQRGAVANSPDKSEGFVNAVVPCREFK
jgi:hypothetical protein